MAVSLSQNDSRNCSACGSVVNTQIWLVIHRLERPRLWDRCRDGSIHDTVCSNNHRGSMRAPLLLFDPHWDFAIYSPPPLMNELQAKEEGAPFVDYLRSKLGLIEGKSPLSRIEVVPRGTLGSVLGDPEFNVGDFAPGATADQELLALYQLLRLGSHDLMRAAIESGGLSPALLGALAFEDGMYCSRHASETPKMTEEAIRNFHSALEFYARDQFPHRWAAIHSELGLTFRHRSQFNRTENLREAIRCCDEALEIFVHDQYPEDYAITQTNRANALSDLHRVEDSLLDAGIHAYREALRVYDLETYPEDCALVHSNLATALMERGQPQDFDDALASLDVALKIYSRQRSSPDWARAKMNRALVLRRMPQPSETKRFEVIQELRAAYEVLRNIADPQTRLATAYNLGLALAEGRNPSEFPEAANLLEESRRALAEQASPELDDCTSQLAEVYFIWAREQPELCPDICSRALRTLDDEHDSERIGGVFHEFSRMLSSSKEASTAELALRAAKRALLIFRHKSQIEIRAKAMSNLGLIHLSRGTRSRASVCFRAALGLWERLEPTSGRMEAIGQLHIWSTAASDETT